MILGERDLPRKTWLLGWVSFFSEVSGNMIYPLLPVFFMVILQIPVLYIGIIEGVSNAAGTLLPVFYSRLLKGIKKRKDMLYMGYGITAFARPLFFFVITFPQALLIRMVEFTGTGFGRPASEDVLAVGANPALNNRIQVSFKTKMLLGAILGPLLAYSLFIYFMGNYRAVFWLAVIPAIIGLLIIGSLKPSETEGDSAEPVSAPAVFTFRIRDYGKYFRRFLLVSMLGSLANYSYFFVFILGTVNNILPENLVLLWAGANIAATASLLFFSKISQRVSKYESLTLSYVLLALIWYGFSNCVKLPPIYFMTSFSVLMLGLGFYNGLSGGLLSSLAGELAPPGFEKRAKLTLSFYLGIMLLLSNILAGLTWKWAGPEYTFWIGTATSSLCGLLMIFTNIGGKSKTKT